MLRKLAIMALVVNLSGCSTEEEDKQVLIDYVTQLKALDDKNKQIAENIEHLRKPIGEGVWVSVVRPMLWIAAMNRPAAIPHDS